MEFKGKRFVAAVTASSLHAHRNHPERRIHDDSGDGDALARRPGSQNGTRVPFASGSLDLSCRFGSCVMWVEKDEEEEDVAVGVGWMEEGGSFLFGIL